MENNVLVATRDEYKMLVNAGVDLSQIDKVLFITPKQAKMLKDAGV